MGIVAAFRMVDPAKLEQIQKMPSEEALEALDAPVSDGEEVDVDKAWDGIHFLFCRASSSAGLGATIRRTFRALLGRRTDPAAGPQLPAVLSELMAGGRPVGGSMADGMTASFDPGQVVEIHEALSEVTDEQLLARFDARMMSEEGVYLSEFWSRDQSEAIEYLRENLKVLRTFLATAAREGKAVLRIFC